MPLSGTQRAQLVYDRAAAKPDFGKLSEAEKLGFLASLQNIYTDDTTYLQQNAVVRPTALTVPPGIGVQVAALSGTGATVAPGTVAGTGTIQ